MELIKKTALVLGATGLIGKELVNILSENGQYQKVHLLVRRPIEVKSEVCEVHFVEYDKLHNYSELFQVTDVFCCLGTTIKVAKTKEAFRKVDYEYPVEAARIAKESGVEKFLIVSSMGADSKSIFFYSQVKGDVEESLYKVNLPSLHIFRPSLLLGKREEFRFGEKVAEKVSGMLNKLMIGPLRPYRGIQARKVAAAMAFVAQSSKKGKQIYLSHEIDSMVGFVE
ncbi:NAD(P)H-binding protein [Neobacillus sp. DY30]|uniref:NAD(P)H-binding protein n=1 Tax=Neobacillus sp. DY30 TaxID=3047871 RepID=UPI0024BFBA2A|nr:NAD(P)H-binding protein [Neobacillus sp. DY30]WHX98341.1 NAD(P)H-binding protein [Neobacillus sp. DY30]